MNGGEGNVQVAFVVLEMIRVARLARELVILFRLVFPSGCSGSKW
jgi:hypothetical protein